MTQNDDSANRRLYRVLREPLVHFLGAAALLFVANALFSGDDREVITIDVSTQEYLVQRQQELMLAPLTEAQEAEAIASFIEEEILVREARKRGFENSSRIRTLLVQNMRFFMASEIPDPTAEDLRTFFEENTDRFTTGSAITYDHVHFANPDEVPPGILEQLRGGADHRNLGSAGSSSTTLPDMTEKQVLWAFGRDAARSILEIDDTRWQGPFQSMQGVHFLRIAERHAGHTASYEDVSGWLESEWRRARNFEILEDELEQMRRNYRIEVLPPGEETR